MKEWLQVMRELMTEDQKSSISYAFLKWIKSFVDTNVPVFDQDKTPRQLSPQLRGLAQGLLALGLSNDEIMELASRGEATAKLDKKIRDATNDQRIRNNKAEYVQLLEQFKESRQTTAKKFGLNESQMLTLFKELITIK